MVDFKSSGIVCDDELVGAPVVHDKQRAKMWLDQFDQIHHRMIQWRLWTITEIMIEQLFRIYS